jgi:hypothetical protein
MKLNSELMCAQDCPLSPALQSQSRVWQRAVRAEAIAEEEGGGCTFALGDLPLRALRQLLHFLLCQNVVGGVQNCTFL